MAKTLKIASWNIAGGRTVRSLEHLDYETENLEYFADILRDVSPDILCLQEVHTNDDRSTARDLAGLLGYSHVYEDRLSPSHIDSNYEMGLAILSRQPLETPVNRLFPNPGYELVMPNGTTEACHEKGMQLTKYEGVTIANVQMLPVAVFGKSYETGDGVELAKEID